MDIENPEGLSSAEAASRLEEFGPNRLPEPKLSGPLVLFARQFLSPFIYILIIAALASVAIAQIPSAVFIVAVLLINAVIGTVQEYAAQKSASALRKMVRGTARVRRDGFDQSVDIEQVVPGDLALLTSGDKVPADIRLATAHGLAIDESALTGESLAVTKNAAAAPEEGAPISERVDMCFAGTVVTHGRAMGTVTATGLSTQIGSIAKEIGAGRLSEPPLMIRIRRFTYKVAGGIGISILALVLLMLHVGGYDTREMAMMSIGLAVSTIPEGLPAALTVALAIGMGRMANLHVIIRKLIAVESLGSCTFICSDKTGTLTVNELTIKKIVLPGGAEFDVAGSGVGPGSIGQPEQHHRLRDICLTGVFANESYLDYAGGEWASDGDIVDVAFLVLAKKLGLSLRQVRAEQAQLEMIPYESERALSGSLTRLGAGACLHVKGSPEKLAAMSSQMMTRDGAVPIDRAAIEAQSEALARQGYRVIALGRRETDHTTGAIDQLSDLTFLGQVAMIDPVRPDAKEAVDKCRDAGIEVAMITGDHPSTAAAIARDLGIRNLSGEVVTGAALRRSEQEGQAALDTLIRPARVFARIEPLQKQQIVDSLMRAGHFVAVTGDGVNDAPAMRRANVGVAMGKRGTDVAKEAADLIIADDRFASIVAGVEQGRVVYGNIRKVIALLIATGFSALLLFFLTVLAGLPMPLVAVQLLWLNLIANGLQDVALAFEPKEGNELSRPPRRPDEPIFERRIIEHVLITGTAMGLLAFFVFDWLIESGRSTEDARNLTLMLMILFGNIHALSSRSETRSLFRIRFWGNPFLVLAVPVAQAVHIGATHVPWLSDVLSLHPVAVSEWLMLLGVSLLLLVIEEAHKFSHRRRRGVRAAK
ncbi:HAD-IC family P-type ATPase [Nisaea acidiphila]|uniref:P-type Cu(+) transporter n=1 Tax=Nisaea acidiphila TaxID=1862145 RepID=A0A9J7APG5_9PROT|nr:HAD-IC family P-type ATPase [Nisaea acidiphila]UUX48489.1 HAD-IC family P-type ATPase [Nisaea acidiphila]